LLIKLVQDIVKSKIAILEVIFKYKTIDVRRFITIRLAIDFLDLEIQVIIYDSRVLRAQLLEELAQILSNSFKLNSREKHLQYYNNIYESYRNANAIVLSIYSKLLENKTIVN